MAMAFRIVEAVDNKAGVEEDNMVVGQEDNKVVAANTQVAAEVEVDSIAKVEVDYTEVDYIEVEANMEVATMVLPNSNSIVKFGNFYPSNLLLDLQLFTKYCLYRHKKLFQFLNLLLFILSIRVVRNH